MSLQAILDAIDAAGRAKAQEIEARCKQQTDDILEQAHLEAVGIDKEISLSVSAPAYRARARILHQAHLEALQLIGNTRQSLVDTAIQETIDRLSLCRSDPGYSELLGKLADEALNELKGSVDQPAQSEIIADPRDQPLLDNYLRHSGYPITTRYEKECWGGMIARSQDGQVVAINTLESRLERALPYLRRRIAAFFEAENSEHLPLPAQENANSQ